LGSFLNPHYQIQQYFRDQKNLIQHPVEIFDNLQGFELFCGMIRIVPFFINSLFLIHLTGYFHKAPDIVLVPVPIAVVTPKVPDGVFLIDATLDLIV
jgi:hypothetical protein